MIDTPLPTEPVIRLAAFAAVLVVMAAWELLAPRRPRLLGHIQRWPSNLGIVALDTILVRVLSPITAVGFATLVEQQGLGLLNMLRLPEVLVVVIAVVVLDFAIYLQHIAFHRVPLLWRLHRMHHADTEIDVSTGLRFHPFEIVLSLMIKFAVIAVVGAPALAVLIFEVLLNATSCFNHSNVRIPQQIDHWLRWIVVTPDMHRVHHSTMPSEHNSNFGFNLPLWDRLFATYRAQPQDGHDGMTIGLPIFRAPREQWLDRMLTQPFRTHRAVDPGTPAARAPGEPKVEPPASTPRMS